MYVLLAEKRVDGPATVEPYVDRSSIEELKDLKDGPGNHLRLRAVSPPPTFRFTRSRS
jgi:hypothetical protein